MSSRDELHHSWLRWPQLIGESSYPVRIPTVEPRQSILFSVSTVDPEIKERCTQRGVQKNLKECYTCWPKFSLIQLFGPVFDFRKENGVKSSGLGLKRRKKNCNSGRILVPLPLIVGGELSSSQLLKGREKLDGDRPGAHTDLSRGIFCRVHTNSNSNTE